MDAGPGQQPWVTAGLLSTFPASRRGRQVLAGPQAEVVSIPVGLYFPSKKEQCLLPEAG